MEAVSYTFLRQNLKKVWISFQIGATHSSLREEVEKT